MEKVGVVTSTRADYGILKNVIAKIQSDAELELCLIVTGTHLAHEYGNTVSEIEEDGFTISERINIMMESDAAEGISKTMGMASILFADTFQRNNLKMLIVLGDRYELLPICASAVNFGIPIAHISGGEITTGAIDDCIRHCISKMSYLHFPGCEEYRKRIIQLGENPERVFNYGDVGVENISKIKYFTKNELSKSLGTPLDLAYMSVTYHPVTHEADQAEEQICQLLQAIDLFPDMQFIFTKANADAGNRKINERIEKFALEHSNCRFFESLGIKRYLSLLKYSNGIIGNSSSGIVEAPSLKIPTVNIGNRQSGRLQAESIINCQPVKEDIAKAIRASQNEAFKAKCKIVQNPYGNGNTSELIVKKIKEFLTQGNTNLMKKFYDINFEVQK